MKQTLERGAQKLLVASLFAAFAMLSSCDKKLDSPANSTPQSGIQVTAGTQNSAGDGKYDLLGYGYDVTGQYSNSEASGLSVIDIVAYKAAFPTYVEESGAETGTYVIVTGSDVEDFSAKLTSKTSIGGTYKGFKGTVDANFSSTDKWSSKYVYAMYNSRIVKKRLRAVDFTQHLNFLQPGFVNHINTKTPAELVQIYGTHVLTDIKLGGEIQLLYRAQTTSTDRTSAAGGGAEFAFGEVFKANTKLEYDQNIHRSNFNEQAMARTVGGNPGTLVTGITFATDGTPTNSLNVTNWAAGVTDNNAELIEIEANGAIPLYEFVSDPTKKAALQSYISQYLIDNRVIMDNNSNPDSNPYSIIEGMGEVAKGGGIAITNLNSNPAPETIFMVCDGANNQANELRYRVAFDMKGVENTSVSGIKTTAGMGWSNDGASIAIADIDGNSIPDLVLMVYDPGNPTNQFRYKIGWNMNSNGDVSYWSSVKQISGISDLGKGAGISFGDIGNNGTLDMIVMAYDYYSGAQQIRYKVGYNVNSSGDVSGGWSSPKFVSGMGDDINGAAISLNDMDNDGVLDLVVFTEDNPAGINQYRYKIGYQINNSGVVSYWSSNGITTRGGCTWNSEGAGMAIGNLDGNAAKDIMLMSIDSSPGINEIRYKVGFNLDASGFTQIWR